MSVLAFQKPSRVDMVESTDTFGKFQFHPLEPGFGMTIGNALRRILLSSLEGYAITSFSVVGLDRQSGNIEGVVEDLTSVMLNFKQLRLKRLESSGEDNETVSITLSGRNVFKAGDLNDVLVGFEVLNPELVICNLKDGVKISFTVTIEQGRGYVPAAELHSNEGETDSVAIDAIFTPIRNVNFSVEPFRVEQRTDYDELVFEITTDGSVEPQAVLKEAASILIQHFRFFFMGDPMEDANDVQSGLTDEDAEIRRLLNQRLEDCDFSVRALNCLKTAEVETLGELCRYSKAELMKFRNFGKKSLVELEDKLTEMGLAFGMDLSKYKLDE